MSLNVTLDDNKQDTEYQDGHIKKIVVDGIFQPLEIRYKYQLIGGGGVDVPLDSISWVNADNGTEMVLGNPALVSAVKKVCCEDALK